MEVSKLARAIALAATAHDGQTRREGTPYIYHPMQVAYLVKEAGLSTKYQVIAVLHDILEDTSTPEDAMREPFGEEIVEAVRALSRRENEDMEVYVARVLANHDAAIVKQFDIISNMQDAVFCGDKRWATKYIKKAHTYYRGKFSAAVDRAIGEADASLSIVDLKRDKLTIYSGEAVELYADKDRRFYTEARAAYNPEIKPNLNAPDLRVIFNYFAKEFGCVCNNKTFYLRRDGWHMYAGNPFEASEYGEGITLYEFQDLQEFVKKRQTEGWFYDFVDPEQIKLKET